MDIDLRQSLKEFWISAGLVVLAFAVAIVGIYVSEAHEWQKKQKLLEIAVMQKQLEIQNKASLIGCYTWENHWTVVGVGELGPEQYRSITKLVPGVEYETGLLRRYDVNLRRGFDQVIPDPTDDSYYSDPIFTLSSDKFLRIRYSIDGGDGWLLAGKTLRGVKTGNLQYIPENPDTSEMRDYYGSGAISVQIPVNGRNGLAYERIAPEISEDMRLYNYSYTERLGEIYGNIPTQFADRERVVHVSHLVIEAYDSDPRIEGAQKPIVTVKLRIRSYGEWNLTGEEYSSMIFAVPIFSSRNFREFSPKITVELVI